MTTPTSTLRLMTIGAHPDDETLGFGGVLAEAAARGIETHVLSATLGQRGWTGDEASNPGLEALGRIRERELRDATRALGVTSVTILDHVDGEVADVPAEELVREIATAIRLARPDVVVTFGHDGVYGHPDHIAVSQATSAALLVALDPAFDDGAASHAVAKLYHLATSAAYLELYERAFGDLAMDIDGTVRLSNTWPDWMITTRVDARAHWRTVWDAVQRHRSQLPAYARLAALPEAHHEDMWGLQEYYRAMSRVNGGRAPETDLFEGLIDEGIGSVAAVSSAS